MDPRSDELVIRHLWQLGVISAALLALPTAALADGKFFAKAAGAPPTIPDQQAMIAWDPATRTQTLVIDTAVNAGAGDLAWVVPVPGPEAPEVFESTTGLFPTLRQVFAPTVEYQSGDATGLIIFGLVALALLMIVRDGLRETARNGTRERRRLMGVVQLALGLSTLTCFTGVLLPSLGTARGSRPNSPLIQILSRPRLDRSEVTVVGTSTDQQGASLTERTDALLTWLQSEGFTVDGLSANVVRSYVERNWVFVCSKVRMQPKTANGGPVPLSIRFKTEQAVYPMALSAVGNGNITLDLYIFGPGTATAENMSVERSGPVNHGADERGAWDWRRATLSALHPQIRAVVGHQSTGTRLHARLSPDLQSADIHIAFDEQQLIGAYAYTKEIVAERTIRAGLAVILGAALIWALVAVLSQRPFYQPLATSGGFVAAVGVLATAILTMAAQPYFLPVAEVGYTRRDPLKPPDDRDHMNVAYELEVPTGTIREDRILRVREQAARAWRRYPSTWIREPLHEDSPTNYVIRERRDTGNIEYAFYDLNGQETVINLGNGH